MSTKPVDAPSIRVFIPVGKPKEMHARPPVSERRTATRELVIGLLDNHKHNTGKVLDRLQQRIGERYDSARFVRMQKPEAGKPAPKDVIEALASQCRAVINGVAD